MVNTYSPEQEILQWLLQHINNPNVDHTNTQPFILALNLSFISIVAFVIALRTLVRVFLVKHVAIEDYLMIGAGLSAIAFFSLNVAGMSHRP